MALEIYFDEPKKYSDLVGALWAEDLAAIGLVPPVPPAFYERDLEMLLSFVQAHPGYHVISVMSPDLECNRFVENARFWMLGGGDPNPNLVSVLTSRYRNSNILPPQAEMRSGAKRGQDKRPAGLQVIEDRRRRPGT